MRLGNEHVMGVYVIWKFAKNKEGGEEVRRRPDARLSRALRSQWVLQLPAVDGLDQGRQDHPPDDRAGHAQAEGQVHDPDHDRREVHDDPGHPGNTTPVMDEIYNAFLIPQMFAEGGAGEIDPAEAVSAFAKKAQNIYRKWKNQGLV